MDRYDRSYAYHPGSTDDHAQSGYPLPQLDPRRQDTWRDPNARQDQSEGQWHGAPQSYPHRQYQTDRVRSNYSSTIPTTPTPSHDAQQPLINPVLSARAQGERHGGDFKPPIGSKALFKRHGVGSKAPQPVNNAPISRSAFQQPFVNYPYTGSVQPSPASTVPISSQYTSKYEYTSARPTYTSRSDYSGDSRVEGNIQKKYPESSVTLVSSGEYSAFPTEFGQDRFGHTKQKNTGNRSGGPVPFCHPIIQPGLTTPTTASKWFKDVLQRESTIIHKENNFLNPHDGRLNELVVQAVDVVLAGNRNSSWKRTYVRNVSPWAVRLGSWVIDKLEDTEGWTKKDWAKLVAQWALSCSAMSVLFLCLPFQSGHSRNGSCYDPVPYYDYEYSESPSNIRESHPKQREAALARDLQLSKLEYSEFYRNQEDDQNQGFLTNHEIVRHFNPSSNRTLRPRKLCILSEYLHIYDETCEMTADTPPYSVWDMAEWMKENPVVTHPDYLFVAYTTAHFDMNGGEYSPDGQELMNIAQRATRAAGLHAFWISCSCIGSDTDDDGLTEDVWRMSDIIRGAKAMAIVVGDSTNNGRKSGYQRRNHRQLLLEWGERMWTLPEALLSPKGQPVRVYYRGETRAEDIHHKNLPVAIWRDAAVGRQLMDHYEGTVILSPLELVIIALKCLNNRKVSENELSKRLRGEMAYVLMGLLRRRPDVNLNDSAFQAFARLSLANDSHKLLERLVCVLPKVKGQQWHDTADFWDCQLWDIYPSCQVAGIGKNDSILLDGLVGGSIRWDRFERVAHTRKEALHRQIINTVLSFSPTLLVIGAVMVSNPGSGMKAFGAIFLIATLGILACSPYLVRTLFTGKLWDTQAFFFGFEGYMDIATIETHIFGANMHRLKWSPFGSTLSEHRPGSHGECVGVDPIRNDSMQKALRAAYQAPEAPSSAQQMRVFTLVDTFTMTVTMFEALRPPVAVLICGAEGGMQRAVLCSFHSESNTFYRESVVRMETRVLGRMSRVARLRFSFLDRLETHELSTQDHIETPSRENPSRETPSVESPTLGFRKKLAQAFTFGSKAQESQWFD